MTRLCRTDPLRLAERDRRIRRNQRRKHAARQQQRDEQQQRQAAKLEQVAAVNDGLMSLRDLARRQALPDFLVGLLPQATYQRWLVGRARWQSARDRERNLEGADAAAYLLAFDAAVRASMGRCAYTGDWMRWELLMTFDTRAAARGGIPYMRQYDQMPTIDHVDVTLPGPPEFVICTWATNRAKSHMSPAAFRRLCERVHTHSVARSGRLIPAIPAAETPVEQPLACASRQITVGDPRPTWHCPRVTDAPRAEDSPTGRCTATGGARVPADLPMSLIDFASLVGFNVGRYRLKQLLGRGAMGAVYIGWDGEAKEVVAVKVLRPELAIDDGYLQRFFQESEIGASIRHDNLVRIRRGGMDDVITPRGQLLELAWLCMDFVSGTPVNKLIGENGRMEPLMAAEVIRHALTGLGYSHSQGVLHGDVKPDNLMISADGTVMLTDLGLARRMGGDDGSAFSGGLEVLGTPHYMAPELWAGAKDLDPRADIFAMGATFYRMLTGVQAFPGNNPSEVLHRLLSSDPEPPAKLNPDVDAQLSGIVMRMLARARDERYRSADEARKLLQMWMENQKDANPDGMWAALVAMGAGNSIDVDDLKVEPGTKKLPPGADVADPRPDDPSKTLRVPVGEKLLGDRIGMTKTSSPIVMAKPVVRAPEPEPSAQAAAPPMSDVDASEIPVGQTLESIPAGLLDAVAAASTAESAEEGEDLSETTELKTPALDLATKHLNRVSDPPSESGGDGDDFDFGDEDFGETLEIRTPSLPMGGTPGAGAAAKPIAPASPSMTTSAGGLDGVNLEALDDLGDFGDMDDDGEAAAAAAASPAPTTTTPTTPAAPTTPPIPASTAEALKGVPDDPTTTFAALAAIDAALKKAGGPTKTPARVSRPPVAAAKKPADATPPVPPPPGAASTSASASASASPDQPGMQTLAAMDTIGELMKEFTEETGFQKPPAGKTPPAAPAAVDKSLTQQINQARSAFKAEDAASAEKMAAADKQTRQIDGMRILTPGSLGGAGTPPAKAEPAKLSEWSDDDDSLDAKLDHIAQTARLTREEFDKREAEDERDEVAEEEKRRQDAERARRERTEELERQRMNEESARHEFVKAATRRLVAIDQQSRVGGAGRTMIILLLLGLIGGGVFLFKDDLFPPDNANANKGVPQNPGFDPTGMQQFVKASLVPLVDRIKQRLAAKHDDKPATRSLLENDFRVWLMLCGDVSIDVGFLRTALPDSWNAGDNPPINAAFDRFCRSLDDPAIKPADWQQELDPGLAKTASAEMARLIWVPRVWTRLTAREGDSPETTLGSLLGTTDTPIEIRGGTKVGGFYHPSAWPGWARTTVELAAEAENRLFGQSAGSYGPAVSSLQATVETRYLAEFRKAWLGFLGSLRATTPESINAAADSLGVFADYSNSPLRRVLDPIRAADVLPTTARGESADWIKDSLAALSDLQLVLHRFNNETLQGERFVGWQERGQLSQLQVAFDSATTGLNQSLAAIQDAEFGAAIRALFDRVLEAVRRALEREARAEVEAQWSKVSRDFTQGAGAGWPFSASANNDASLDSVISLLHPASGSVWRVDKLAAAISGLTLAGKPLVALTPGWLAQRDAAMLLTERLFGGENRATVPRLAASVMLRRRKGASKITLVVNGRSMELQPGRRVSFQWSAEGGMCQLKADSETINGGEGPWALLRVLGSAESADIDTQRTQFTFQPAEGVEVAFILETAEAGNPFKADLFSRVQLPGTISVKPLDDDE